MALSKPQMKLVTCPLCDEAYKFPKTLPCLHSFCEKCIHDFIVSIGKTKGNSKDNKMTSFYCPICRTVVRPVNSSLDLEKWAESLPRNVVAELIIAKAEGQTPECILCKRLDRITEAMHWCCQCQGALCQKCKEIHGVIEDLSEHRVSFITNTMEDTDGFYFNAIKSIRCRHQVKQYCNAHGELLCNVCRELSHKTCKEVTNLDATATIDELCASLPVNLTTLKETFVKLVKERERNKAGFRERILEVENTAKEFIEIVKSRLDELFETFKKELSVFLEEENTKINVRLRLLEQFTKTLEHWINVTSKLKGNASDTQILVLFETIKSQIDASIKEIKSSFHEETTINLSFEKNKHLSDVLEVENVGTFDITKERKVDQMQPIYQDCGKLGLIFCPSYEDIEVKHVKQIKHSHFVDVNLTCGAAIDQYHAIVGNVYTSGRTRLWIVNLSSGTTQTLVNSIQTLVNSTTFAGDVKRVCFDKESNKVFISCNRRGLYMATVCDLKISKPVKLHFNRFYIGDLCMLEDKVFVVALNAIKSFSKNIDPEEESFKLEKMSQCFKTNTDCGINGLDSCNGKLFFTTKNKEIKCSTVTGEDVFCLKSPSMMSPIGIAVLPNRCSLILDSNSNGKLHIVSHDGGKNRTLLESFENVRNPKDIWLGVDQRTLYVCGGDIIDVYEVSSKEEK